MVFDAVQAERPARDGAILVEERCGSDPLLLIANGSYQLEQMRRAAQRLAEAGQAYRLVYLQELDASARRAIAGGRGGGRRGAGGTTVPG